jgi:hypothetical protein
VTQVSHRIRNISLASLLAAVLIAALVAIALAAPLRSRASGASVQLRPDGFVAIPVDGASTEYAGTALPLVPFDPGLLGNPIEQTPPQRIAYASVADAARDFRPAPRVPRDLPERMKGEPEVVMLTASSASYVLDLPKIQRQLASAGLADLQLPTTMHGAKDTVDVPAALTLRWGEGRDSVVVTQLRQPRVTFPAEAELPLVRELLLSHPMVERLSPGAIAQLRALEHWQTTLPVPIPTGAVAETVSVDGADGLFVSHGHQEHAALVWQRRGVNYLIAGWLEPQELLAMASSLR